MNDKSKYLEQNVFNDVYDKYALKIINLAYTYLKDYQKSEDICHDTFVQLIKSNPDLEGENLKAWLYRVAINKCKDYFKSSWFKTLQTNNENIDDTVYYEQEYNQEYEYIRNLLDKLPQKFKDVIVLYYFENLSINQIAEVLNISIGTVSSRIHRGKQKMANLYRGDLNE